MSTSLSFRGKFFELGLDIRIDRLSTSERENRRKKVSPGLGQLARYASGPEVQGVANGLSGQGKRSLAGLALLIARRAGRVSRRALAPRRRRQPLLPVHDGGLVRLDQQRPLLGGQAGSREPAAAGAPARHRRALEARAALASSRRELPLPRPLDRPSLPPPARAPRPVDRGGGGLVLLRERRRAGSREVRPRRDVRDAVPRPRGARVRARGTEPPLVPRDGRRARRGVPVLVRRRSRRRRARARRRRRAGRGRAEAGPLEGRGGHGRRRARLVRRPRVVPSHPPGRPAPRLRGAATADAVERDDRTRSRESRSSGLLPLPLYAVGAASDARGRCRTPAIPGRGVLHGLGDPRVRRLSLRLGRQALPRLRPPVLHVRPRGRARGPARVRGPRASRRGRFGGLPRRVPPLEPDPVSELRVRLPGPDAEALPRGVSHDDAHAEHARCI